MMLKRLGWPAVWRTGAVSCVAVLSASAVAQGPQLAATRVEHPPKIAADPEDPAWAGAPVAGSFVDDFTNKPVADQTQGRLVYDQEALYVLFVCYDSNPSAIVGREIVPESTFSGEDTVTFSIDTFDTHAGTSMSRFTVNAINTRTETIAGGHSGKAEWRGVWQSTTKRFDKGYIVEMRIPWKILSYPNSTTPLDMDINFDRFQNRTKTQSQWAYMTLNYKPELLGRLKGISPPLKDSRSRWQFLAYDAPQVEDGVFSNRVGLDGRLAVTNQQTALFSISPDFLNIEQQIAGVSFVHTERFLNDARPFFTEGGDYFNPVGQYEFGIPFYSERIGLINFGSKFYGQVSPIARLGTMAIEQSDGSTATFSNYQITTGPMFNQSFFASSYENGSQSDVLAGTSFSKRFGDWAVHSSDAVDNTNHRNETAGNVALLYSGPKLFSQVQGEWVDSSFNPVLSYTPWQNQHGYYTYTNFSDTVPKGPIHDWNVYMFTPNFNESDGTIQQRGVQTGANLTSRSDQAAFINRNITDYATGTDNYWDIGYTFNATNRFKQASLEYQFGEQDSMPSRYVDVKGSLRVLRSMDLGLEQSVLTFAPSARQTIGSIGWQIDSRRSITGRYVNTDGYQNFFLSFQSAGWTGAEMYFILGDPNSVTFSRRVSVKFVWAF